MTGKYQNTYNHSVKLSKAFDNHNGPAIISTIEQTQQASR